MRTALFTFLIIFGAASAAENKNVKTDFASEAERAEKIESYKEKKTLHGIKQNITRS